MTVYARARFSGLTAATTLHGVSNALMYTIWSVKRKEYCTIWKNKYRARAPILSPFRTPPNAFTFRETSSFDHFWVDAETQNYTADTHKSSPVSRFLRGRVKTSKNTIPVYKWPENGSLFCDQILLTFVRKSS